LKSAQALSPLASEQSRQSLHTKRSLPQPLHEGVDMTFVEAGGDVSIVTLDRGVELPPPLLDATINSKGTQRIGIPTGGETPAPAAGCRRSALRTPDPPA